MRETFQVWFMPVYLILYAMCAGMATLLLVVFLAGTGSILIIARKKFIASFLAIITLIATITLLY